MRLVHSWCWINCDATIIYFFLIFQKNSPFLTISKDYRSSLGSIRSFFVLAQFLKRSLYCLGDGEIINRSTKNFDYYIFFFWSRAESIWIRIGDSQSCIHREMLANIHHWVREAWLNEQRPNGGGHCRSKTSISFQALLVVHPFFSLRENTFARQGRSSLFAQTRYPLIVQRKGMIGMLVC